MRIVATFSAVLLAIGHSAWFGQVSALPKSVTPALT
jgi:hypothetical protein